MKPYTLAPSTQHKKNAIVLLDKLYMGKMRQNIRWMKKINDISKNKAQSLAIFERMCSNKLNRQVRISFEVLKNKAKLNVYLLGQLSNVFTNVNRAKLAAAFLKIASIKPIFKETSKLPTKVEKPKIMPKVESVQPPQPSVNQANV